ncbi:MAG: universal stress protein [Spirosomataceae bacterium]
METLSLQKILVPIDFSGASFNALQTAVAMAKRHQATLVLAHIISIDTLLIFPEGGFAFDTGVDAHIRTVTRQLEALAMQINTCDQLTCRCIIKTDVATSSVVKIAAEESVDLIVTATHEVSGFYEFFMGSRTYTLLKHAHCPVLTVPEGREWLNFKKILFPIRPITNALKKYDFARKIIRKNNAELIIMGVFERWSNHLFKPLNAEAVQVVNIAKKEGVKLKTEFHFSDSLSKTILGKAHQEPIDLLVITATLTFKIQDLFAGPFPQQIVKRAKIPVLSVRE